MLLLLSRLRQLPILVLLMTASWSYAVDENRLWLPKTYSELKPKLLAAAQQAEADDRCILVMSGEMIVSKNTAENYYFLITCRDQYGKTYSLSYLYPVMGEVPTLLTEQRLSKEQGENKNVEIKPAVLDAGKALQLCRNDLESAADMLNLVTLISQQISAPVENSQGFFYVLPFTAKSALGNEVRYHQDCQVTHDGKVQSQVVLQSAGALALCQEALRAEGALLGRLLFDSEQISESTQQAGAEFNFQIPFDVKNRIGSLIRYSSDCQVSPQGEAQVRIFLTETGALAICKNSMLIETLMMRNVKVAEQPSWVQQQQGGFNFHIPFTANGPDGGERNFKAICEVDEDGEADIVTEIDGEATGLSVTVANEVDCDLDCVVSRDDQDQSQVVLQSAGALALCQEALQAEGALLGRLLFDNEQISESTQQAGAEFNFQIPFDVKNRIGSLIRYSSDCRVSAQDDAQVGIFLTEAGALAICKSSMLPETLLMRNIKVAEQPSWVQQQGGGFNFQIPFTANDPEGNERAFKAICKVDKDGEANIVTGIDGDTIMSVCVNDLKLKTRTMRAVVILEHQLSVPEQHMDGGYIATIPFDAKDPSGRALYYKAICTVDSIGRSSIEIEGRRR